MSTFPAWCGRLYQRSIYSQNGEDGVIAEVLRRLRITNGWFCEFGAWDGRYGSNCYALLRQGWQGVMIEADPRRFRRLTSLARRYEGRLLARQRFIRAESGPDSLDALLAETPIPADFGVLSIDIDGSDYQVWQSVADYYPAIVIIEVNSYALPGVEFIHGGEHQGSSFSAMLALGRAKGYDLVCHTGNMIFVRQDLTDELNVPQATLQNPDELYSTTGWWVDDTRLAVVRHKLRFLTWQRVVCKLDNIVQERLA